MHNVEDRSAGGALLIIIIDHGESLGMRIRNRFWANSVAKRERETQRGGRGHHVTAVKCTIQQLPHAACHLPPVAAVSNGDFHGFWPESSNCLNFFLVFQIDQTRPETRDQSSASQLDCRLSLFWPAWPSGQVRLSVCPTARPEGDQGPDDDATVAPPLPLSLPLFLSLFLCLSFCWRVLLLRPRC